MSEKPPADSKPAACPAGQTPADARPKDSGSHVATYRCGGKVTVFAFAGVNDDWRTLAVFEFRRALQSCCADYNHVFFRDRHLSYYQATPDRQPGGLDFFAAEVQREIASLGSDYHVAIGCSMGAAAALYFGARCRMDLVIAFSPVFPTPDFAQRRTVWRAWANLPLLARSRSDYIGNILLTTLTRNVYRRTQRAAGEDGVRVMWDEYRAGGPLPRVRVYYAERVPLEKRSLDLLASCCPVEAIALPTVNHNTPGYLKARGQLANALRGTIEADLARRDAPP